MKSIMLKIWDFLKRNVVLVKFYALLLYLWGLFYFLLQWPWSRQYIATNLPIFMADTVAFILNLIGIPSVAQGPSITVQNSFSFSIIYQCAGIFGMMIYAAAVIAFPSKWREKLWGFLIGIPGLYVINTIRMTALGIIGLYWRDLFDWFHEWMWQGIFIVFVIFFWLLWKEKFVKSDRPALVEEAEAT